MLVREVNDGDPAGSTAVSQARTQIRYDTLFLFSQLIEVPKA